MSWLSQPSQLPEDSPLVSIARVTVAVVTKNPAGVMRAHDLRLGCPIRELDNRFRVKESVDTGPDGIVVAPQAVTPGAFLRGQTR